MLTLTGSPCDQQGGLAYRKCWRCSGDHRDCISVPPGLVRSVNKVIRMRLAYALTVEERKEAETNEEATAEDLEAIEARENRACYLFGVADQRMRRRALSQAQANQTDDAPSTPQKKKAKVAATESASGASDPDLDRRAVAALESLVEIKCAVSSSLPS